MAKNSGVKKWAGGSNFIKQKNSPYGEMASQYQALDEFNVKSLGDIYLKNLFGT